MQRSRKTEAVFLFAALWGLSGCVFAKEIDATDRKATRSVTYALERATTCTEIRGHLIEAATERVLAARYPTDSDWLDGSVRGYDDVDIEAGAQGPGAIGDPRPPLETGADREHGPHFTDTNNQERGVDEPDLLKIEADGGAWILGQGAQLAYVAIGVDKAERVDSAYLGADRFEIEAGIEVVPRGLVRTERGIAILSELAQRTGDRREVMTRLQLARIERGAIAIGASVEIPGRYLSARRTQDDRLHLVTEAEIGLPPGLDALEAARTDQLDPDRAAQARDEARREVRAEIARLFEAELPIEDEKAWLDRTFSTARTRSSPQGATQTGLNLFSCQDVYLPPRLAELGVLQMSTFSLDESAPSALPHTIAVLARSSTVYASPRALYTASSGASWWRGDGELENVTHLHKFSFFEQDGRGPSYAGSGEIEGQVLNRYAMSEYEGVLRVVTSDTPLFYAGDEEAKNRVVGLTSAGRELVPVASIDSFYNSAPIAAVRLFGELGLAFTEGGRFSVTALRLGLPSAPQGEYDWAKGGQLSSELVASYIHPLDDGRFVVLGSEGDTAGAALMIVDVSDEREPTILDSASLSRDLSVPQGEYAWSAASVDPLAFTFEARNERIALPIEARRAESPDGDSDEASRGGSGFVGAAIYRIEGNTLSLEFSVDDRSRCARTPECPEDLGCVRPEEGSSACALAGEPSAPRRAALTEAGALFSVSAERYRYDDLGSGALLAQGALAPARPKGQ